jgi:putative spermidine/putrescine transport system ATP-binding protein
VRADKTRLSRTPRRPATPPCPPPCRRVEYQGTYVLLTAGQRASARAALVVLPDAEFDAAPWQPGDSACAHWTAADIHVLAA